MYKIIFKLISVIFGLKTELVVLHKPIGAEHWAYSKTKDTAYQLYVTNHGSCKDKLFGFWVCDDDISTLYKKAYEKIVPTLKWSFTRRFK